MRFEVLGPLRVHGVGGREVMVRPGRDQTLLAMLVLHADRTVPVDRLVDALWSDAPPQSARNQVQACVSQLRKRLSQVAGLPEGIIVTDPVGYRLRVGPEQVDVHQFRAHLAGARAEAAAGRRTEARDRLRAALDLWRGPALAGMESAEVRRAAVALDEEHIQAVEERVELDLALGGAGELVGELSELVQRYPYREGIYAALMHALYRAGRMTEALATFRRARQVLHDELGAEPGEELQRLHQAILNRDRELTTGAEPRTPALAERPVPHELPPEVSCFVGRDKEIAEVREVLAPADPGSRRRPAVVVLYGPGGVGKSALAVRVAHDLADAFPDGQLYVDLCGSTPGMRPLGALEVLGRFLRSLGVHPSEIPAGEAEAAALFRSVTADRRLLLLLDNAATKEQVVPLLPANPGCGVIVTSRYPQPSVDTDHRLRVSVLADVDSLALLTGLAGVPMGEASARAILALTGGLPLAIRIAGGRLACRPDLPAAEFAERLADRSSRLDELQLDDLAVRASVRTSYDALQSSYEPTEGFAARTFRMLGLLHVPDVAPGVVAAMLAERHVDAVRAALDRLVDAQLIEAAGGRYRLHDLVRLVATERAVEDEAQEGREDALRRAMEFYAIGVNQADSEFRVSTVIPLGTPVTSGDMTAPTFLGRDQARRWIDEELPNLLSAMEQAANTPGVYGRLPLWLGNALWNFLDMRCAWQAALRLSQLIVSVAESCGNKEIEAWGFLLRGRSEACFGNYHVAAAFMAQATTDFTRLGHTAEAALALNGLGVISSRRGDPDAALSHYQQALEIAEREGLTGFTATLHDNMSVSYTCLGRYDRAAAAAVHSLEICAAENLAIRPQTLLNLSASYCLRRSLADAVRYADVAIQLSQEIGDRMRECEALIFRCEAKMRWGQSLDALEDATKASELAEGSGYRYALAVSLRQQCRALTILGRTDVAEGPSARSIEVFAELRKSFTDPLINCVTTGSTMHGSDSV